MTECPFAQASSWDATCGACFDCPHQRAGSWEATCSKLASEEVPVIVYQNLNKGSE